MIKIDKTHKQIDLKDIDLKKAKELGIKIGSISLALFMLSGCGKKTDKDQEVDVTPTTTQEIVLEDSSIEEVKTYNIQEHDPSEHIECNGLVINEFDDGRTPMIRNYTYDDLAHAVDVTLTIDSLSDSDLLNYMPNVKNLWIHDNGNIDLIDNVDGSRLSDGIKIEVDPFHSFDRNLWGFLEDIGDIDTLEVSGNIDGEYLQSLRQVHNLKLGYFSHFDFQYIDLTYLDSLTLGGNPYNISMLFSNELLNELEENGVEIYFTHTDEETVRDINNQIDDIVDSLEISEDATDQEKLNAVLTYVLCEYEYDSAVSDAIHNYGIDSEENLNAMSEHMGNHSSSLEIALEEDTLVCADYADITSVLLRRLGVESYVVNSSGHAWNAVKIGDYYYFVDATWLDNDYTPEYFVNNDTGAIGDLTWYLVDPTDANEIDSSGMHDMRYIPNGLEIQEIPDEIEDEVKYRNVEDISDKEFEVTINGKIITIGAAAFVGVLSALGIGKLVYDKKERERRRRLGNYGNRTIPREEYRRY